MCCLSKYIHHYLMTFQRDSLRGQGERNRPEVKISLKLPFVLNPNFYFYPFQSRQSLVRLALTRTLSCRKALPVNVIFSFFKLLMLLARERKIVKPESEVPKLKVPKSRPKGLGLTLKWAMGHHHHRYIY